MAPTSSAIMAGLASAGCRAPSLGRLVEAVEELAVGRGGDGGRAAEGFGELAGQAVGAVMAAEQRHDRSAVLRDGEHRRLVVLVVRIGARRRMRMPAAQMPMIGRAFGEELRQQFQRICAALPAGADVTA